MIAAQAAAGAFFRNVAEGRETFDGERFLIEVDALFGSEELLGEVRWRLEVLHDLAEQRGMEAEFDILRDELTRIFATGGSEQEVVDRVKRLTEIEAQDGRRVDLRHFLIQKDRRVYTEDEYRDVLRKKIENTAQHVVTLMAFYPGEQPALRHLSKLLSGLGDKMNGTGVRTRTLKTIEDNVREMKPFQTYETLKERFLRDWLARFTGATEQELAQLGPEEVHRLISEHQRHQTTQLVKGGVRPVDSDVSEHLGVHDTLEGEFRDEVFWERANSAVKRGFHSWVLRVVQAFGMVRGNRYAFFQSDTDKDCYLLAGLGLPALPGPGDEPITMVPYLKPFTRKAGYLLEVRQRAIGDSEQYHQELRHYTLPFLFGFDQVDGMEVPKELRSFFNSAY